MKKQSLLTIGMLLIAFFVVVLVITKSPLSHSDNPGDDAIVCTLDAKLCPDGSAVGRSGPNCEFDDCPEGTSIKSKDLQ